MAKKYLDYDGLLYFWQKIKTLFVSDVTYNSTSKKIQKTKAGTTSDLVTLSTVATSGSYSDLSNKPSVATTSANGLMSSADKGKLDGIASSAEVNQNAFSNVKVGSTIVAADAKMDTLELAAGSNVTLTPDATNDKVTIESDQIISVLYGSTASDAWYKIHSDTGKKYVYCAISNLGTIITGQTGLFIIPLCLSDNDGSGIAYYFYGVYDGAFAITVKLTADAWTASYDAISNTDTKNTAGTTNNTGTKLYLVGGTAQQGNIQTYSNGKVYIGTDNCLYSNSTKVATLASPTFTGTPKAPTATAGNSSTQIATTAFVQNAVDDADPFVGMTVSTDVPAKGIVPAPPATDYTRTKKALLCGNKLHPWVYFGLASYMSADETTHEIVDHGLELNYYDADTGGTSIGRVTMSLDDALLLATPTLNGLMSSVDKSKLNGIASGAEVNVQSDWNQTTTTADDFIKNKPTLGAAAAKGVVTSISSDSTDLPTVTAVKGYVDTAVTGATAYQGIAPTTFAPTNYKAGWYWVIGTAGTYCGQTCEAGDMIFCKTAASTYSASNFDVVQTNLDITSITNAEIDTILAA